MVSMLQPVRFESCPLLRRSARGILLPGIQIPLEPVVTTGRMVSSVTVDKGQEIIMNAQVDSALGRPESPVATKEQPFGGSSKREGLMAAGGTIGAIAASSCCILPLVLFALGIS